MCACGLAVSDSIRNLSKKSTVGLSPTDSGVLVDPVLYFLSLFVHMIHDSRESGSAKSNVVPVVLPIKLTPSQVRPIAYRVISKKHGLNLKYGALVVLAEFLGYHFGVEWRGAKAERFIDDLARMWRDEGMGLFVEGQPLATLIEDWVNAQAAAQGGDDLKKKFEWRNHFSVISATEQRRVVYDFAKKRFVYVDKKPRWIGDASALVRMALNRYHVVSDRLHRNELFESSSYVSSSQSGYVLTQVKNLLGRNETEHFLFGLLCKDEGDGPWSLLDHSGSIRLEFTDSTVLAPDHYYNPGSLVLCHGIFHGTFFQVCTLGAPPPERREATRRAYGYVAITAAGQDFSGERSDKLLEESMVRAEKDLNHFIVILGGDLFLDKMNHQDLLRKILKRLESDPPIAIVLTGSFFSMPFQPRNSISTFKESMDAFAMILREAPSVALNSKIILIPGDNDPWHAMFSAGGTPVWPLAPIPEVFRARVDRVAANVVWSSNPTRLCYLSQEIVIARDNIGDRLRKNSLKFPSENRDPETELEVLTNGSDHPIHPPRNSEELDDDQDLVTQLSLAALKLDANLHIKPVNHPNATDYEVRKVFATILDQGHLSPFPLQVRPVAWEYEHALNLSPWPSTLILVDTTTPSCITTYEGCRVLNPGPFMMQGKGNYMKFWPSSGACDMMYA